MCVCRPNRRRKKKAYVNIASRKRKRTTDEKQTGFFPPPPLLLLLLLLDVCVYSSFEIVVRYLPMSVSNHFFSCRSVVMWSREKQKHQLFYPFESLALSLSRSFFFLSNQIDWLTYFFSFTTFSLWRFYFIFIFDIHSVTFNQKKIKKKRRRRRLKTEWQ